MTLLNEIAKEYDIKIPPGKTKSMNMHGRYPRRIKMVVDNEIIEQVSSFNCLGCKINNERMKADLETNIVKYNTLNGCVRQNFGKNMMGETK